MVSGRGNYPAKLFPAFLLHAISFFARPTLVMQISHSLRSDPEMDSKGCLPFFRRGADYAHRDEIRVSAGERELS